MDPNTPCEVQDLIEKAYSELSAPNALLTAKDSGDLKGYNMRLRIRDFATIIEADEAMHYGDVGRLISMWQMWALMAHGITGLPRYVLDLTRFIFLVEQDLPKPLARVIKHSLLIPTPGREKHWVRNDLYLERQKYWLKHFYNSQVIFLFGLRRYLARY